jgi:hypothetical protein
VLLIDVRMSMIFICALRMVRTNYDARFDKDAYVHGRRSLKRPLDRMCNSVGSY